MFCCLQEVFDEFASDALDVGEGDMAGGQERECISREAVRAELSQLGLHADQQLQHGHAGVCLYTAIAHHRWEGLYVHYRGRVTCFYDIHWYKVPHVM